MRSVRTTGIAIALVALLVCAPLAASLVPLDTYRVRVAMRGADDDISRLPHVGLREPAAAPLPILPSATATCMLTGCALGVPRAQYHWFDLLVEDLEGRALAHAPITATFHGHEGGPDIVTFTTDAEGRASILRRPAEDIFLETRLTFPSGGRMNFTWLVEGETEGASAPLVLRSEGRLLEARIDILRRSHVWIDHHAVVRDASQAEANALVTDLQVTRGGVHVFGAAAYAAFSHPHDVDLAATSLGIAEESALPVRITNAADSSTVDVRGVLDPSISFLVTLGHVGDGADAFFRIYADPSAYRVTLREMGPLLAHGPEIDGIRASAHETGVVLADLEATLQVPRDGLVLMDAAVPVTGAGSASFRRDDRAVAAALPAGGLLDRLLHGENAYFLEDGACDGAWSVALQGYLGLREPSVAIAYAEAYQIPAWARADFPELGFCS